MCMTGWDALAHELDAWGEAGDVATLWWRDDDAGTDTPALRRLLALAAAGPHVSPTPLNLAVIPVAAQLPLSALLARAENVTVLQHGYAHANHAPAGAKKAEFLRGRPVPDMLAELRAGRARLRDLFGAIALPVLVPPWNRIDPALVERLPDVDITGLSIYGPRTMAPTRPPIVHVNAHVDLVDWHGGRGFVGAESALKLAIDHLAARRQNRVDRGEATGLLTHHLVHDDATWDFIGSFVRRIDAHGAARWLSGPDLFRRPPGGAA
jgi:hypothetical protein